MFLHRAVIVLPLTKHFALFQMGNNRVFFGGWWFDATLSDNEQEDGSIQIDRCFSATRPIAFFYIQ